MHMSQTLLMQLSMVSLDLDGRRMWKAAIVTNELVNE